MTLEEEDSSSSAELLLDSGSVPGMTLEEDDSSLFAELLLDSGSVPGMTLTLLEVESGMTEEESSPHANNNAKMDPIAAMRLQDDSTKYFFILYPA
jgi:hypothetical protein